MLTTATTELIHSVLDGEASDAEAQQLLHLLAADPAARAEFDAAERLFADFKNVPQRHPPEGLVAAVMAAVEAPAAKADRRNQLFSRPGVVDPGSRDKHVRPLPDTPRSNRFHSFLRSIDMSQQTRSPFGSRKIWIGSAIALAAVVGVTQFGLDGKTSEKDVIGTIAPAERYRAPQPAAADVKVEAPTAAATSRDAKLPAEVVEKSSAQATAADRAKNDLAAADKARLEAVASDKAQLELATAERAKSQLAAADRAKSERATADRATAERATAERATAERASAERVSADRAAADRAVQKAAELAAEKAAAFRAK